MYPRKAVDVNLKTDPTNIETKVEQIELHSGCGLGENAYRNRLREADVRDTQQRIAAARLKARHDVNVTDCTLAIGDVVYIRVRTWRGTFTWDDGTAKARKTNWRLYFRLQRYLTSLNHIIN